MYKLITFIKVYFLQITCIVLGICLIGVWINSCQESKNEKEYNVSYTIYGTDTSHNTVITKGFPQLDKYKDEWRFSDNSGEILSSTDSISINKIELK
jgi:hypothetical protein